MIRKSQYETNAGIYKLTNIINGKVYIGKSINIRNRLARHKSGENKTKGKCYLQNAIIKYGWDNFKVDILEIFQDFEKTEDNNVALLEREAYYIQLFESTDRTKGYNRCKYSSDTCGMRHTEDAKNNMKKSWKDRVYSDSMLEKKRLVQLRRVEKEKARAERLEKYKKNKIEKEKLREYILNNGRKLSIEHKEKLRLAKLGKKRGPLSEDHKRKIGLPKIGKPRSEETREKIRKAHLGNTYGVGYIHTDEAKEKMSQAKLGKKHGPMSEEQKQQISKANKGRKHTPEAIDKMKEAAKIRNLKKKDINELQKLCV
jgi:group I intron endonuclease